MYLCRVKSYYWTFFVNTWNKNNKTKKALLNEKNALNWTGKVNWVEATDINKTRWIIMNKKWSFVLFSVEFSRFSGNQMQVEAWVHVFKVVFDLNFEFLISKFFQNHDLLIFSKNVQKISPDGVLQPQAIQFNDIFRKNKKLRNGQRPSLKSWHFSHKSSWKVAV